jgi:DNA polymerase-1
MKKVLIDSNCIGSMALFAMGDLRMNEVGTGVVYGLFKQLQTIYKALESSEFIFCWDSQSSIRKEMFPGYKFRRKEDRTKKEQDIWATAYEQFHLLRTDYLPWIGFKNQLIAEGFEADDILAKVAQTHKDCILVTTDGDLLQCLPYCDIWNPRKRILITAESFKAEWEISPEWWGEVKAIAGCKSDTVPGVAGVGEKTAIKYLKKKLSVTSKRYKDITNPSSQKLIERNRDLVVLPLKHTPSFPLIPNEFSFSNFQDVCFDLGMNSLLEDKSLGIWIDILSGN